MKVYLIRICFGGRAGRQVQSCSPRPPWQAGYKEHTEEAVEYLLGKEGFWDHILWFFISAPISWGEEGSLSLYSWDQKSHGVGAWWVLVICKANFIAMRAWWTMGYIWTQDIPTFPHLSLSATCFLLSSFCPGTPAVHKMYNFLPPGPCLPFSAHTYLPACCNKPSRSSTNIWWMDKWMR